MKRAILFLMTLAWISTPGCADSPANGTLYVAPDPAQAPSETVVHEPAPVDRPPSDPVARPEAPPERPEVVVEEPAEPPFEPSNLLVWEGEGQVQVVGFSKDTRRLAFLTTSELLQGTLRVLDLDTGEVKLVDDHVVWGTGGEDVGLSDDGARLVYRRSHDEPGFPDWTFQSPLWTWGWEATEPVQISANGVRSSYRVTPDGAGIVYAEPDKSLSWYDVATGESTELSDVAYFGVYGHPRAAFPITDDSGYLTFTAGYKYGPQRVVDLKTLEVVEAGVEVWSGRARWVPGTHTLLFPERLDYQTGQWTTWAPETGLGVVGGPARLKQGWNGAWTIDPAFGYVAYPRNVDNSATTADIYVLDLSTGEETFVSAGVRTFAMGWSPAGHRLAYMTDYGDNAGSLHVWTPGEGSQLVAEGVYTWYSDLHGVAFDETGDHLTYTVGACDEGHALYLVDLRTGDHVEVSVDHACSAVDFGAGGLVFVEPGFVGAGDLMRYRLDTQEVTPLGIKANTLLHSTPDKHVTAASDADLFYSGALVVKAWSWVDGTSYDLLETDGKGWVGPMTDTHVTATVKRPKTGALYLLPLP